MKLYLVVLEIILILHKALLYAFWFQALASLSGRACAHLVSTGNHMNEWMDVLSSIYGRGKVVGEIIQW